MEISLYSISQLELELEKRKKEKATAELPQPLGYYLDQRLDTITDICVDYIESVSNDKEVDDFTKNFLFEACLEGVYGASIWDWIDKTIKERE